MSVYDRSAGKRKQPNWWIRYSARGEEIREPGKGSLKATRAWEAELRRQVKLGTWVHPKLRRGDAAKFTAYARAVIDRRVARGVKTADKDERGHVENHLIPWFGDMRVDELRFLVIKQAFAKARDDAKLAGRTLRNVHSTLRAILIEAAEDGLIDTAPTPLSARRDHLPPPIDRDSRWRESARFERGELAALLGCDDVPILRRTIYAVCFLTGARISEVLSLRVSNYAPLSPWPALSLRAAKVGRHRGDRRRHVPVCPELKVWLDWWLAEEWPFLYGAAPISSAWMFPSTSARRRGKPVSQAELFKLWQRHDLPAAKLRHRRIHDTRRTFVSLLRSAGVPDKAVRACTHASTGDRVLDAYTSWEWGALCEALSAVTWGAPKPGKIGTPAVPLFAARAVTPENKR